MIRRAAQATPVILAISVILFLSGVAGAATTYTWNVASGSWTAAASWSPARTTPATDDILIFDGGVTATASVSSVPNQTIGQLHLINGVQVTLTSGIPVPGTGTISKAGATVTGTGTLFLTEVKLGDIIYGNVTQSTHEVTVIPSNTSMTVTLGTVFASQAWSIAPKLMPSGGPGDDFVIAAGSSLTIASGIPPISIYLLAGATGEIAGTLTLQGNVHRLHAASSGAMVVGGGGVISVEAGYLGNPFTVVAPANILTFQSGSTFVQKSGANAFALPQPASKVIFQTGSLYRFMAPSAASLSGRIYADLEFDTPVLSVATGGTNVVIDNLVLTQGGMELNGPLGAVIKGNLAVAPAGVFEVGTGGPMTVAFAGTTPQSISGPGSLTLGPSCAVSLGNAAGLTLARDVTIEGSLTLTSGNVTTGSNLLSATGSLSAGSNWINGRLARAFSTGPSVVRAFPIGDATTAAPVSLEFSTVGAVGTIEASTSAGEGSFAGSGLFAARSVNRRWKVTPISAPAFASATITLDYPASEVDGGVNPANLKIGKFDAPSTWTLWTPTSASLTSITAPGIISFSDFVVAEPCPPISVLPATLPAAVDNQPYGLTLTAVGGVAPYSFAVTSGTLPAGLSLSGAGLLSGSPTTPGSYSFTVTATDNGGCSGSQAYSFRVGDVVLPMPNPGCISTAIPCVSVPVRWERADATPARAYSVTLELSANLALCGVQFASGGYLVPGSGGTSFLVTPLGGNQYTIDEATLGLPCGATGDGTLFNLHVSSTNPGGSGTITVLSTLARDCSNVPVPAFPGVAATIPIDNVVPASVTLSAAQKKIGNSVSPVGTTDVLVSWTGQEVGTTVAVYRKGFGGYPQYDENSGMVPAVPVTPAAAVLAGWTSSSVTASGGADRSAARDFYYFVAFAVDGCGNASPVSNRTNGTLNYLLGDVHDGATNCAGNNAVNTSDISFLGANYGLTLAINDPLECLDVGPTTDFSVDARPTTDNKTGFEDLIVFAINHGAVAAPKLRGLPAGSAANALALGVPVLPGAGGTFAVSLDLEGAGNIQGFTAELDYDREVVEFLGVEPGELLGRQATGGVVLSSRAGTVDVALLGTGFGLRGQGAIARALFRVRRAGDAAIALKAADARDQENLPVVLEAQVAPVATVMPTTTTLAPARPTPFRDATVLEYALARGGMVELTIYSVDGRRIATLERGEKAAGLYRIAWDGRDERGGSAAAGLYYARLTTTEGRFSRTLIRVR